MSKREDIQNDVAEFLESVGLDEVYGVLTGLDTLDNGRKVRTVTFCRARSLDGQVIIYHGGGTGGYDTYLGFNKSLSTGAIVLFNSKLDESILLIGELVLKAINKY